MSLNQIALGNYSNKEIPNIIIFTNASSTAISLAVSKKDS